MTKITLTDLANLQNENTAVSAINSNNAILEVAFDNTLSRDGTSPNTMGASFDMNSHRVLNLPAPVTSTEPLRLQDLMDFVGGSLVISPLPIGGTTGQVLAKASNTNYDYVWSSLTTVVDSAANNVYYPVFSTTTSGAFTPRVDSANFTFNKGTFGGATTSWMEVGRSGTVVAGDLNFITINGPTSGANGGAFLQADYGGLLGWGIGNFSSINGGAFNFTTTMVSTRGFRWQVANTGTTPVTNTFLNGPLYVDANGDTSVIANVAANQLLLSAGTTTKPIWSGTNLTFDPTPKQLVVRRTSSTIPVPGSTTQAALFGGDSGEARLDIWACNSDAVVAFTRNNNNMASTTALVSGDQIMGLVSLGIGVNGATTPLQGGAIGSFAAGNWTNTAQGTEFRFFVIPSGTTTFFEGMRVRDVGGAWLSQNTSGNAAVPTGTVLQMTSPTNTNAIATLDGFSNAFNSIFYMTRSARGNPSSFTVTQANDSLGGFAFMGCGTNGSFTSPTSFAGGALILSQATENFTGTQQGTLMQFYTTPTGTIATALAMQIHASGGLSVGSGADPGIGVVNANVGFKVANAAATSGNFLRGDGTKFVSAPIQASDLQGAAILQVKATGVNFNSANSDTSITIPMPTGFSRYQIFRLYISHASASLTTSTFGVFTAAAGGGTAIVASGTANTVSTAAENTANNTQSATIAVGASGSTTSINTTPLFFRVQTPQGSAATGDVTIQYHVIS